MPPFPATLSRRGRRHAKGCTKAALISFHSLSSVPHILGLGANAFAAEAFVTGVRGCSPLCALRPIYAVTELIAPI